MAGRFGNTPMETIDEEVNDNSGFRSAQMEATAMLTLESQNTIRAKRYIWRQFEEFCKVKNYALNGNTPVEEIANVLKDFAYNMRKADGTEYKELTVKTMWNVAAKLVQEKYYYEYHKNFNPFHDVEFKAARDAKEAKRKLLRILPEKRKQSVDILTFEDHRRMVESCDEDSPDGLQKKFFLIASYQLVWRAGEGTNCLTEHFLEEMMIDGTKTGRILYKPGKTCGNKFLIRNESNPNICPVRLYKKLLSKRAQHIRTTRLFLQPNPNWIKDIAKANWYNNAVIGKNTISKWTSAVATNVGLDTKKMKITNHSNRSLALINQAVAGNNDLKSLQKYFTNKTAPNNDGASIEVHDNNVIYCNVLNLKKEPAETREDFSVKNIDEQFTTNELSQDFKNEVETSDFHEDTDYICDGSYAKSESTISTTECTLTNCDFTEESKVNVDNDNCMNICSNSECSKSSEAQPDNNIIRVLNKINDNTAEISASLKQLVVILTNKLIK